MVSTDTKVSEKESITGREIESGVGCFSVPASIRNDAGRYMPLKVPSVTPQERRKKSSSRKIATGGQIVH